MRVTDKFDTTLFEAILFVKGKLFYRNLIIYV